MPIQINGKTERIQFLIFSDTAGIIVAHSIRRWRWRTFTFYVAALWVALVGLSRIYLGAHYLTDVLGAIAVGLAWVTFCWTGVETLRKWRERRHDARS